MRLRALPFMVLLPIAALASPSPASAAGHLAARVEGSFAGTGGEGTFEGTLMLSGFERRGERLVALGTLDGSFADAAGKRLGSVEDRAVTAVVDSSSLAASCERAKLTLQVEDVESGGLRADLRPVEVEIGVKAVPGGALQAPLCELGKAIAPSADLASVAQRLDGVLAALE